MDINFFKRQGLQCTVCGGTKFGHHKVLWKKLIDDWELSKSEIKYINRQQGTACKRCGCNIRSIALSNSIRAHLDSNLTLEKIKINDDSFLTLEINEAGFLTKYLKNLGNYKFASYPEVDMQNIPFKNNTFDLIVHSDTLEHVKNPLVALAECHRVLKKGGGLCFTAPTIVGKLTRNRKGLTKSYHGSSDCIDPDFLVHTEFGADIWTYLIKAGFNDISIHTFDYPAGIAFSGKNNKCHTK